jgi:hypothetical protein
MTHREMQQSLDWALTKTARLQEELSSKKDLLLAITTAMQMSNGDNAKAGQLIRQLLEPKP